MSTISEDEHAEDDVPPEHDDEERLLESFEKLDPAEVEQTPLIAMEAAGDLSMAAERLDAWGIEYSEPEEGVLKIEDVIDQHQLDNLSAVCHVFNAASLDYNPAEGLTLRFGKKSRR